MSLRIKLTSVGPKKKERWSVPRGVLWSTKVFWRLSLSYSGCTHVIRGGVLAVRMCLSHTGSIDGAVAPFAISATADMN